jgi:CelD/BcsL family acetyltransferase involved in cellulose biosynthesis
MTSQPGRDLDRTVLAASPNLWAGLGSAWTQLLAQTAETSAFLSSEYIQEWLVDRDEASALLWKNGAGDPVGAAILCEKQMFVGPFPIRTLVLNSPADTSLGAEHNDVLVLPAYRLAVLEDLAQLIESRRPHKFALNGSRQRLVSKLSEFAPSWAWDGYSSESPFVGLDALRESGMSHLDVLSSNTRSQVRRSLRLYEKTFGAARMEKATSLAIAEDWFDEMLLLHDARWTDLEGGSGFSPAARELNRKLMQRSWRLPTAHGLQIDLIKVSFGDEVVGILENMVCRGHVQFYQGGLRYHEDKKLKPGLVSHALAIQHYLESGASEYDFLGGEPEPVRYKRSLSTDSRTLYWGGFSLPGARMRALNGLRRARRMGRRQLEALRS